MVNYTTNYFMKKYALGDLKKFERRNEYILCPTGDYTEIKNFPSEHKYMFEHFCVFGDKTIFPSGNEVSQIVFGEFCKFGKGCNFGSEGRFGFGGVFGDACRFQDHNIFASNCYFGKCCNFGEDNE